MRLSSMVRVEPLLSMPTLPPDISFSRITAEEEITCTAAWPLRMLSLTVTSPGQFDILIP